jgi:hypothetical protein
MAASKFLTAAALFFLLVPVARGAADESGAVTINGVTYDKNKPAGKESAAGYDDSLRLKKVFLFPAVDDMNGVLSAKLDEKLVQLFSHDSRFNLVRDPQVVKALSPDDKAYGKATLSPQVHKEAARVTGADTTAILRSKNVGKDAEMTLELRDAQGNLLFSETGSVPGLSPMSARLGLIEKLFRSFLAKIPFDGTVTGRTAKTVTLDLGSSLVRPGEEVEIARIVSIQRHPLLGTIVGVDYVRIGKARITTADSGLSFAEITEEHPGEVISAGAKVLRTRTSSVHRPEMPENQPRYESRRAEPQEGRDPFEDRLKGSFDTPQARFGQVGANLQYGSLSHSQTASGATADYSGSGIGGDLDGEIWVTKNWIVSGGYSFHSASLSGDGTTVGDTSWHKYEGFAGYRFFPEETAGGLTLTGSLGYQVQDFNLPTPSGTNVGAKRFAGLALRLSGEMLLLRDHKISGGFGFQPFSSLTESGASLGEPDGGTVIGFHLAWNYRLADMLWGRLGFEFETASGSYTNNNSVTDKRFAIGPGLYYSF